MTADELQTLVRDLLDIRVWTAFDIDADGRVLAGTDDLGSLQLVEIAPDGTRTPLTDLPSRCSGRYLPGARAVVVEHDQGGDEHMQLSLLDLTTPLGRPATLEDLAPLVADPAHMHNLQDVTATSLVYSTNRRNDVDMDVVVRDLATGEERVVFDEGGYVAETVVSHDGRSTAVNRLSLLPNSMTVGVTGPDGSRTLTDVDEPAFHADIAWSPDDRAVVMASNHDREFTAVVRLTVDGAYATLVEDPAHDLQLLVLPRRERPGGRHARRRRGRASRSTRRPVRSAATSTCPPRAPVACRLGRRRVALPGRRDHSHRPGLAAPRRRHDRGGHRGRGRTRGRPGRRARPAHHPHQPPRPDPRRRAGALLRLRRAADGDPAVPAPRWCTSTAVPRPAAMRIVQPGLQAMSLLGFTVLVPNVRGSTGYGKRWYSLDDVEQRLDSVADLAALHAWLPDLGLDPARSALWGGSYGGYMVLAGVSMQPDLWAAGVDIVGMSSLVTFLENTSGYRRAFREREYGSLERDHDVPRRGVADHLPRRHRRAAVRHPRRQRPARAALGGPADRRRPRAKGVACELRVYDDEGHGLAKRVNRLDAYPAAMEFLLRRWPPADRPGAHAAAPDVLDSGGTGQSRRHRSSKETHVAEVKPLRKVLIANRGEIAVRVIRACKDAGIAQRRRLRRPRPRRAVRPAGRRGATPRRARRRPTPTSTSTRSSRSPSAAAPTRCTPATASSPRTPASPRPSSTPGWCGSDRRRPRSTRSATRCRPRHIAQKVGAPLVAGTTDPVKDADEVVAFAREHGLPIAIKAAFGGGGRGLKVARTIEEVAELFESAVREAVTRVRPRRVLRRALPRQAAARRDPVPGRPARQRRRRVDPRLLAAAPAPEARRGGAGAVPLRRPDRHASTTRPRRSCARPATSAPAPASSSSARTARSRSSR